MKLRTTRESGIALIVTLLLTFIFTLMTLGFFFIVTGEQRIAASDRDNGIAFYSAQAGLEKMSAQLVNLFQSTPSPTTAQVDNIATGASPYGPPSIPGVTFPTTPINGYQISYPTVVPATTPPTLLSSNGPIGGSGPLSGLQGVVTPFTLTVVAQSVNGAEVKLVRQVQNIAVPVFQFGIFSDNDLSFFAGPAFQFGGRVHTNANLFLAEGSGILTLSDKVTAYKDVIRTQMSNGATASTGVVNLVTSPGAYRALATTEGSLTGGPGSAANTNWPTISKVTYNGNIKTQLTGAMKLKLTYTLGTLGPQPIEMIRRPPAGESLNSDLAKARFFNQASLRILLSDSQTAITGLPGVTSSAPYPLDESLVDRTPPTTKPNYLPLVTPCNPPMAQSRGNATDADYMSPLNTSLLAGAATSYIKIEIQKDSAPGTWQDVTQEILSLGISKDVGTGCTQNKSVLHLEKLAPGAVAAVGANPATDYVPINIYDAREGEVRDSLTPAPTTPALGGIMNLVELDIGNLQKWFANTLDTINAPNGALALHNSIGGYIVYFSDRRTNTNGTAETGEYGFDDIINPADANGIPNGTLDAGEDVHNTSPATFNTYGNVPRKSYTPDGTYWTNWFAGPPAPTPLTRVPAAGSAGFTGSGKEAQKNGVLLFRRALRLVNGALGNLPPLAHANCSNATAGGFTVAAENPIYVLGNYNASSTSFPNDTATACHVPAAVIGDAVTVLSNSWSDDTSFTSPASAAGRAASLATYYRMAIIGGKNNSFPNPTWPGVAGDFGTDGGVHNFIRYLESWGTSLNYLGSLLSFYTARQAVGVYKCCNAVYSPPTRNYSFDTDFTNINTLPPGTPRFSDVNALSFQQVTLPN